MKGIWNMKIMKSGKLDWLGSSVKDSLNRIMNDKIFRGLLLLILIGLVIYTPLLSIDYYLKSEIVYLNTVELNSDVSIEKVSYVNEEGRVFLDNGDIVDSGTYQYTYLLYGNDFWYSTDSEVLAVPLTLKQGIVNAVSYILISWSCFGVIMILLVMLNIGFRRVISSRVFSAVFFILSFVLAGVDMITYFSISKLFSNIAVVTYLCRLLSIIIVSMKLILLIKYTNWVDSKCRLC